VHRHVWLRHQSERDVTHDDATVVPVSWRGEQVFSASPVQPVPPGFERAFQRDYPGIRRVLDDHRRPGLGLFVSGAEGLEASAWLPCGQSGLECLVIGRHSHADFFLPSDARLSLRHLLVVVHRSCNRSTVGFRVLDLRTASAFLDEQGRRLEAVESEGPLMLQCASFALLLLPTADTDAPWPQEAAEAWKGIPGRVYLDWEAAEPDRWRAPLNHSLPGVVRREVAGSWPPTLVGTFPGPALPCRVPEASDPARGKLVIRSPSGRASLRLGAKSARRGVLLGRYERCDAAGLPVLGAGRLSRVHVLFVEIGGVLYALDTASRNGTWLDGKRIRSVAVEPGMSLDLAQEASVEWCYYH
jgi:FHA domain